jgi:putative NADH-flavin reductase
VRIFLLGATGRTGRAVVEQAAARGHRVTAFVRSPDKLAGSETVTVIAGDPRDRAQLARAMPGADVVISTLGPPIPSLRTTTILGDAATATVEAMTGVRLRRLLIVSGDLQFAGGGGAMMAVMRATLLRTLARDQAALERATRAGDLDWTIARPTRLTDRPTSGTYRAEVDRLPASPRAIACADVARFLLDDAEQGVHVGRVVGLAR